MLLMVTRFYETGKKGKNTRQRPAKELALQQRTGDVQVFQGQ
jgi:hypothetical protein